MIETDLEKLKSILSYNTEDNELFFKINKQYEDKKLKLHTLQLKIAKKNRELSTLKRKFDDTPSRIELSQYQKRFVELYNQSNYCS